MTNDPSPLHHLLPLKRLQSNLKKKKHSAITSLNVLTILHLPETSPQSNPRGQRTSTRSKSLAASSEKRDDRARLPGSSTRLETCGWKKKEKERKREERRGEDNHRMPRRCATAYTASATTPVLTCRHIDIVIICKCGGARTRGASRRAATTHPWATRVAEAGGGTGKGEIIDRDPSNSPSTSVSDPKISIPRQGPPLFSSRASRFHPFATRPHPSLSRARVRVRGSLFERSKWNRASSWIEGVILRIFAIDGGARRGWDLSDDEFFCVLMRRI